jgi:hypothetical protein
MIDAGGAADKIVWAALRPLIRGIVMSIKTTNHVGF